MVHLEHFCSVNSFATINKYHFINVKIVRHSNRAVQRFVLVRDRDSLESNQTNTSNAGDDNRDVRAIDCIYYGDLEVKAFPAIPHMPYETAWFKQFIPAILKCKKDTTCTSHTIHCQQPFYAHQVLVFIYIKY